MNRYEHTLIAKQDLIKGQIDQLIEKYKEIISKNSGKIIKFENWGLMNFAQSIKKNKKGYYFHFKFEGSGNTINELEKNEKIDQQLIRFLTIKVKEFDVDSIYFGKKNDEKDQER